MTNKIKILDCTLRDGGYINNWDEGFTKYLNKGAPAYVPKNEPLFSDVISFVLDNYDS